jgi:hypothetical protein
MVRSRRRVLCGSPAFGLGCLFWPVVTVGLAVSGRFPLLQATGLIAVGQAVAATPLALCRRWLQAEPLPAQRPASTLRAAAVSGTTWHARDGCVRTGFLTTGRHGVREYLVHQRYPQSNSRRNHGPKLGCNSNPFTAQLNANVRQHNAIVK